MKRPLVFTNGVFDILHCGHVAYLQAARELGAFLMVGVNTDVSARRLEKGTGRPLNTQRDRSSLVGALRCVDAVVLFSEDTPCELMRQVCPDIYVKGGDYDIESLTETALVRSWGGKAVAIPLIDGYSTTRLVQRIRDGR